jgi:hypothetical protein
MSPFSATEFNIGVKADTDYFGSHQLSTLPKELDTILKGVSRGYIISRGATL